MDTGREGVHMSLLSCIFNFAFIFFGFNRDFEYRPLYKQLEIEAQTFPRILISLNLSQAP